jgi:hypothetical protein
MGTQQLWILTAEILMKPTDLASGDTKGFTNIVTWADSANTGQQKVSEVLKSYGWELLGIEGARRFDESRSYDDDILEIVEQARANPDACIIGTVFTYKPDEWVAVWLQITPSETVKSDRRRSYITSLRN